MLGVPLDHQLRSPLPRPVRSGGGLVLGGAQRCSNPLRPLVRPLVDNNSVHVRQLLVHLLRRQAARRSGFPRRPGDQGRACKRGADADGLPAHLPRPILLPVCFKVRSLIMSFGFHIQKFSLFCIIKPGLPFFFSNCSL